MKIKLSQLRRLIKEEVSLLHEGVVEDQASALCSTASRQIDEVSKSLKMIDGFADRIESETGVKTSWTRSHEREELSNLKSDLERLAVEFQVEDE